VRVKIVERPDGATGKAEADDLAQAKTQADRDALRRRAEAATPEATTPEAASNA
jgi:hypothetical protein